MEQATTDDVDVDVGHPTPCENAKATPQWQPPRMDELFDHSPIPSLVLSPTYTAVCASRSLLRSWGVAAVPPDLGSADVFDLLARHEGGWDAPQTALLRCTFESAVRKRSCREMRAVLSPPGDRGERKLTLRVVPVCKGDELLSFVLEWQENCKADTTGAWQWVQTQNLDELFTRGRDMMARVLNRDGLVTWSSTSTAAKLGCDSKDVLGQHWAALLGLREIEVSSRNWISRRDDPKKGFWAEVQEVSMTPTGSDSSGQYERVLIIRDLTEELVMERELQDTRREIASLLSSGGDGDLAVGTMLEKPTVDAAGIVRKIIKEEESKSKDGPRTINTEFGKDIPPRLLGDPVAFAQIARALISNAVEYSSEGEDVSVRLASIFQDEGSVALGLTVTDRGIGVDKDVETTLFYSRAPSLRHTASGEATRGLSLYLAEQAARKMDGCLGFNPNHDAAAGSGTGKGTVFTAQVKLARCPMDPPWVPPPSHAGGRAPLPLIRWLTGDTRKHIEAIAPRTRILFVDDNSIQRKVFQKLVAKIGFTELDLAASGQEGVDRFLANPLGYDMVFMDRHMPGMSGTEATEKIRSAGFLNVPIIDMNPRVWGDPTQNQEGRRTWIAKPFGLEALARTIMDWVPKERTTWPVVINSRL